MTNSTARPVRVDWLDSKQPVPGWQWVSELEAPTPARCTSIGFLVGESDEALVLAQSLADADDHEHTQAGGAMTIPRACVLNLSELAPSASSSPCPAPASGPKPQAT